MQAVLLTIFVMNTDHFLGAQKCVQQERSINAGSVGCEDVAEI